MPTASAARARRRRAWATRAARWLALVSLARPARAQECHFHYSARLEQSFTCFTNACFNGTAARAPRGRNRCENGGACCLEHAFEQCASDGGCSGFSMPFYGTTPFIHGSMKRVQFISGCPRLLGREACAKAMGAPTLAGFAACYLKSRCEPPAVPSGTGDFPACFGNVPDSCEYDDWRAAGLVMGQSPEATRLGSEQAMTVALGNGSSAELFLDGCFEEARDHSITSTLQTHVAGRHTVGSCARACPEHRIVVLENNGGCHCGDSMLTPVGARRENSRCGPGCRGETLRAPDGSTLPCGRRQFAAVYSMNFPEVSSKPEAGGADGGGGGGRPAPRRSARRGRAARRQSSLRADDPAGPARARAPLAGEAAGQLLAARAAGVLGLALVPLAALLLGAAVRGRGAARARSAGPREPGAAVRATPAML